MKKYVLLAILALSAGCYKTTVVGISPGGSPGREVKKMHHGIIGGLVMFGDVDAQKECGNRGVWSVETKLGVVSLLASGLTSGIYTPISVVITCKD